MTSLMCALAGDSYYSKVQQQVEHCASFLIAPTAAAGAIDVKGGAQLQRTALCQATDKNSLSLVRKILDAGANPETADFRNDTPLLAATDACFLRGDDPVEMVKLLVESNANLAAVDQVSLQF